MGHGRQGRAGPGHNSHHAQRRSPCDRPGLGSFFIGLAPCRNRLRGAVNRSVSAGGRLERVVVVPGRVPGLLTGRRHSLRIFVVSQVDRAARPLHGRGENEPVAGAHTTMPRVGPGVSVSSEGERQPEPSAASATTFRGAAASGRLERVSDGRSAHRRVCIIFGFGSVLGWTEAGSAASPGRGKEPVPDAHTELSGVWPGLFVSSEGERHPEPSAASATTFRGAAACGRLERVVLLRCKCQVWLWRKKNLKFSVVYRYCMGRRRGGGGRFPFILVSRSFLPLLPL